MNACLGSVFAVSVVLLTLLNGLNCQTFSVGRGIADITGLASEGALYGYANPSQKARGLHLRQYSRAYVFDNGSKRAAFVVVETAMISQAVHKQVMEYLEVHFGDLYTEENVMLSPTHSHSSPGGFHTFWMYQAPSLGFINETFNALVNGIFLSIMRAHQSLTPANAFVNAGILTGANANRSPYAYYNNPAEEVSRYEYDVDKQMTLLRFNDASTSRILGLISFFAVHTTSMKNYNHLVSSDNKGYAAQMMERMLNPGRFPGQAEVVAAFTQLAEGDASPNTDGSRCELTNEVCWYNTSTCPEAPTDPRLCTGRGPAGEQFADTATIGAKQFQMAQDLYEAPAESVGTEIDFRMQWVNMSDVTVLDEFGEPVKTCRPSMGHSFAAGATDGPGIPPFYQGMLEPLENLTGVFERFNMSDELIACHAPKPILLPTGELERPWTWQPEILPLQLMRIGKVILVGVPAEVTTMSGRRLENAVKKVLTDNGWPSDLRVLIIAMANSFSSYLTTFEEYQMQRYEGASTTYGPNLLKAYTLLFEQLAQAMATGQSVPRGESPPDLRGFPDDALGVIKRDDRPPGTNYGDVLEDVYEQYNWGETVKVTFVAGNPRNNLMTDKTFLEVQRRVNADTWNIVAVDADWETRFYYTTSCDDDRNSTDCTAISQKSNATITWEIPGFTPVGTYRIVHYGHARQTTATVVAYTGTSSEFQVNQPSFDY